MIEKRVEICTLLDFYGKLLTPKQLDFMHKYFELDKSLAEIGDEAGVSRQAVKDAISVSEKVLYSFEDKLGLARKYKVLQNDISKIIDTLMTSKDINAAIDHLKELSNNL